MLQRATPGPDPRPFHKRHAANLVAVAAGSLSLVAAFLMQFTGHRAVTDLPNPWVTVPLLIVAALAVAFAFLRREPHRAPAVLGLGMAAVAVALGWVVVASAVAAGALIICLIIAKFM